MLEKYGSLKDDNNKIDWSKKYKKRVRTIEEIKKFAIEYFKKKEYKFISRNC
jgi:hypothetical protein